MPHTSLYLYTSVGCHLCEQAEALLVEVMGAQSERVLPVEVADSDELMASYALRIPVVAGSNRAGEWCELGWPFDAGELWTFLQQFSLQ